MNRRELADQVEALADEALEAHEHYAAVVLLALVGAVTVCSDRELAQICATYAEHKKQELQRGHKFSLNE